MAPRARAAAATTSGVLAPEAPGQAASVGASASASSAPPVNAAKHPIGIILMSLQTPKDIRFSISRDFFNEDPTYASMPERLTAEIMQWISRDAMTLKVLWDIDQKHTHTALADLLDPDFGMKLEPYADGRSAPKAKGTSFRREYTLAMNSGPYAPTEVTDGRDIEVTYKEGARELTQVWKKVTPQHVREDWRGDDRFRLKTTLPEHKTNTFEKVLFNLALLLNLAKDFTRWFNSRLPSNEQTTPGEIVKFWGLMGAATQMPGIRFDRLWQETPRPGDLVSPPNFGKFGMSQARAKKLKRLHQKPFDPDEKNFDETDPSRYIRSLIAAFNDHRERTIIPSWLLVGDESMSLWLGTEGVLNGVGANPFPIPNLSFIERKPDPLGAELKVLADGNCGVFLRLEFQEGAGRHCHQEFYEEYGHSAAVSLRLLKPYFKVNSASKKRAYYADSWFMGVNAAEAIHYEV